MARDINFLDIFAGCGGLSEGFIRAGFNPVAHVEMDVAASYSLKTRMAYHWLNNNKKRETYIKYLNREISREELYSSIPESVIDSVINEEISELTLQKIFKQIDKKLENKKIHLVIGGPPCQAYSLIGRSCDKHNMLNDKRNYLYQYYAKFLKKYKPMYFIFENVTGLLSAEDIDGTKHIDNMLKLFNKIGYQCECKTMKASDFGVPQNRERIFILGMRESVKKIE